jgi:hypothetical protein
MSLRPANPELILAELDRRMAGHGNGAVLARELGVDAAHLRAMKSGSQAVSPRVAAGLGFELRWVRVEQRKQTEETPKP